jgi:RNA-directed DNA polymerase
LREKPVHRRVRRLAEWLNPTNAKKVHSLVDKVYQRKNLEIAWERVRANRGSGGVDGQTLEEFTWQLNEQLDRLHSELKQNTYQPQPVRQVPIPKLGKPGEFRLLGIPTIKANCTGTQLTFGMGGDPPPLPPTARPAVSSTQAATGSRYGHAPAA